MSATSVFDAFLKSVDKNKDNTAFVYRSAEGEHRVSYEKLFYDVLILSKAFEDKKMKKGSKVLLLSDNRYAWIVTDLALVSLGAVSVPRGSDTPTQELEYIVEHSECEYLIFETEKLYEMHKDAVVSGNKEIKSIFIIESEKAHKLFTKVYAYNDILTERGISDQDIEHFRSKREELTVDDVFTLIYTSGTTGTPKGVILTHKNFLYNIENLPEIIDLRSDDIWLSILPTWHIFERAAEYLALTGGCCTVYSTIKTFSQDLEQYRPTIVATVPRLWESLYIKVNNAIEKQGEKKKRIFDTLVNVSSTYKRNSRLLKNHLPVFEEKGAFERFKERLKARFTLMGLYLPNKLASKKLSAVQDKFGGRMRLAISGGGSLPPYLDEWIDALGIRIINAYGMTECAPAIAGRALNCEVFGTLGPPVHDTQLRIVDEEGNTLPNGEEGEIQVKGDQVFPGYYNNDEENEKSFTEDGYFRTGDLGKLTLTGELVITGRIKEIIVLASGENIDPSRIESTITKLPFIKDAVLVGQDRKGLGALVIPDMEKIKEHFSSIGEFKNDMTESLRDAHLIEAAKREMNKLLHPKKGFKPYEKIQSILFLEKDFEQGEELTNTLKKKRHAIEKKYSQKIQNLFKKDK
ncbi:AMP-dependent synthetase/ligase [Limisalsivibrio acetivorans]|uniref:AMP-dependent synthetase/ligase n=1 Tax=Limisalsivibrio acetivorans TaxID=1304888 RepID=UPI0003B3713A|nr:long-chain fatty acid--CoA ligase [Limisalsivibrio acetivorans]